MMTEEKQKLLIRIFGVILFIIFPIISTVLQLIKYGYNNNFLLYSIPEFLLYFLIVYGLFKLRYWARYLVIAIIISLPLSMLGKYLWYGPKSTNIYETIFLLLLTIFILIYFFRENTRKLFGEHVFKPARWYGLIAILFILAGSAYLLMSLSVKAYYSWKDDLPLFAEEPKVMEMQKPDETALLEKFQRVQINNVSLLIPKEFRIFWAVKDSDTWSISLFPIGKDEKGMIILSDFTLFRYSNYENHKDYFSLLLTKKAELKTGFDIEKFMLTNDWNPIVLISMISTIEWEKSKRDRAGEIQTLREIHINGNKGFMHQGYTESYTSSSFSLYSSDGRQLIGGRIWFDKQYHNEKDLLSIISSFEFLKPEDYGHAANHYEKGLKFYNAGDTFNAQFEFVNAYYLSPDNPDYLYMVAESIYENKPKKYTDVKNILHKVLELDQNHQKTKTLLKKIEEPKNPASIIP